MKVFVQMLAFEDGKIREVNIPDNEWNDGNIRGEGVSEKEWKEALLEDRLELVFRFGQNDFQPRPMCSVSVGDVIILDGEMFMVMGGGFKKITEGEYLKFWNTPRRERSLVGYEFGKKE